MHVEEMTEGKETELIYLLPIQYQVLIELTMCCRTIEPVYNVDPHAIEISFIRNYTSSHFNSHTFLTDALSVFPKNIHTSPPRLPFSLKSLPRAC